MTLEQMRTPGTSVRAWIVNTASTNLMGRAIRALTDYPVSHSLMLVKVEGISVLKDSWFVAEATADGFFPRRIKRELARATWREAFEILLPQQQLAAVIEGVFDSSGRRYDWGGVLRWVFPSLLNKITGKKGRWRPRLRDASDRVIYCSEIVSKLLTANGFRGIRGTELSPGELGDDMRMSPDSRPTPLQELLPQLGVPWVDETVSGLPDSKGSN